MKKSYFAVHNVQLTFPLSGSMTVKHGDKFEADDEDPQIISLLRKGHLVEDRSMTTPEPPESDS